MTTKSKFDAMNRRQFLSTTAWPRSWPACPMPKIAFGADKVVKIGFLAPLTGAVAAWGKPGLDGCQIWADWVNDAGGIQIGGEPTRSSSSPMTTSTIRARRAPAPSSSSRKTASSSS